MRTLLVAINSLGEGGAERSTAELLPYVRDAGINVVVVCLDHRAAGVEADVLRDGFDVRFLAHRSFVGRVREMRRIMRAERPDVTHATVLDAVLVARVAAIGLPTVVLTSVVNTSYRHAFAGKVGPPTWKLAAVRRIDGWTARHLGDHIHAISNATREAAIDDLAVSDSDITVIPRGRDPARLGVVSADRRNAARVALDVDPDAPVVVAVGRQEHQKGHVVLLDAIASLVADRPSLVALVAGRPGAATRELQARVASLDLREHVRFLGHRDDVPEIIAAGDVFVLPSLWEGMGGVVLEAMGIGVPIVASDVPGLRGVLRDTENSLLVEPGDVPALAGAIAATLDDPDAAAARASTARADFDARFTAARAHAAMLALYRRLADERS